MKLVVASLGRHNRPNAGHAAALAGHYADRAARLQPTELLLFEREAALLETVARQPGRAAALLVLFDSRGDLLTSEEFAQWLGRLRDEGAQRIIFAIGPADGWSPAARAAASRILSLGRITLPHELARAVVAEQVYRALTILAGHPYHSGH